MQITHERYDMIRRWFTAAQTFTPDRLTDRDASLMEDISIEWLSSSDKPNHVTLEAATLTTEKPALKI